VYQTRLAELVGQDAARVGASYYKLTVAGLLLFASVTPLALAANPGQSSLGLGLVLLALIGGTICGARAVILSVRCGRMASAYLTRQWGRKVEIGGVRVGLSWWRWRIEQERERPPV
jgi:hypothetical protein